VDAGDGNCVQRTQESVRDLTYKPLSRPLYIYVNQASLKKPEVAEFVDFYLKVVGELAPQVGYVPVSDEVATKTRQNFDEAIVATKTK